MEEVKKGYAERETDIGKLIVKPTHSYKPPPNKSTQEVRKAMMNKKKGNDFV